VQIQEFDEWRRLLTIESRIGEENAKASADVRSDEPDGMDSLHK
jgi:hypothetical protein